MYSDRPTFIMGGELVGWEGSLALTQYNDRFRDFRRYLSRVMGTKNALRPFHGLIETESRKFLRRLIQTPEDVHEHIRKYVLGGQFFIFHCDSIFSSLRTAGAIILMITYGYDVKEGKDPYVDMVDKAMENFTVTTTPGAFLVDVLPALRHVPNWFPGARFKALAAGWRSDLMEMVETPFAMVKRQMVGQKVFGSCVALPNTTYPPSMKEVPCRAILEIFWRLKRSPRRKRTISNGQRPPCILEAQIRWVRFQVMITTMAIPIPTLILIALDRLRSIFVFPDDDSLSRYPAEGARRD